MKTFDSISNNLYDSIIAASTFISFTPVAKNIRFVRASDRQQTFSYSFFIISNGSDSLVLEIVNRRLTEKEYLNQIANFLSHVEA
jgi:hypothetical protein